MVGVLVEETHVALQPVAVDQAGAQAALAERARWAADRALRAGVEHLYRVAHGGAEAVPLKLAAGGAPPSRVWVRGITHAKSIKPLAMALISFATVRPYCLLVPVYARHDKERST